MSAWDMAKELYKQYPEAGTSLEQDLMEIAQSGGYVYCGPECIIAAIFEEETWRVFLASGPGALSRFFELAPHESKWVTFERPAKKKVYCKWSWGRIKALCKQHSI